jgi:hypothetical protein
MTQATFSDPPQKGLAMARLPQELRQVQEALAESSYWPLPRIQVEFDAGQIILRGVVNSYYLKQVAQTVAVKFIGGFPLLNCLHVETVGH